MAFGVTRDKPAGSGRTERRIVKAVTTETVVALVVVGVLFALFAWKMGLAFMFKTMMATAHDLILNTVLFLMAVIILAGAFTSFIAEFGIVSIANRLLSPLMRPLFGLPGATSIGVVATYLSDNPAIMPLTSDKGFLKYFKKWQVTTLVNLGTVFGMGLIVTTFMLAQSSADQPLGRAVLLGNLGAILGGIVSVRLMGHFGKKKYGADEDVLTEEEEGYDILHFREVRQGNVAQRALQSLLEGGAHGVQTGLDIMPGIVIICTFVMMLAYGATSGVYTGAAYEGVAFFPWLGDKLSFLIEPLFGFSNPQAIAFPVTSLGSVGAALATVPKFLESGIVGAKEICVFTAIGICMAGFLSTHVGMMDGIKERDLTNVAIVTHFAGGLSAGVFRPCPVFAVRLSSGGRTRMTPKTVILAAPDFAGWPVSCCWFQARSGKSGPPGADGSRREAATRSSTDEEFEPEEFGPARWQDDGLYYTTLEPADSVKDSKDEEAKDIVRYETATGLREVVIEAAQLVPEGRSQSSRNRRLRLVGRQEDGCSIFTNTETGLAQKYPWGLLGPGSCDRRAEEARRGGWSPLR